MNYKKMFAPYVWRLRLEAFLKALLTGLIIGFGLGVVATVAARIVIWECDLLTMMLYSLYAGLILTVPCYFFYRPNIKKAAKRVDKMGLHDRMSTMLALKDDGSYIASVQREDAAEKLKGVKASKMPFAVTYKPFATVAAMMVALCLVSMVPYRQLEAAAEPLPPEIVEESRIIKDLIAQLRLTVEEADIDEEIRTELNAMIDELEATVDDFDTTLEKAAKISELRSKIIAIIEREVEGVDIGEALIQDEATAELGEAIKAEDEEKLHQALENLRNEMMELTGEERQQWLSDMAEKLNAAIEEAGGIDPENPDEIMQAVKDLADTFTDAAAKYDDETEEDPDDSSQGLAGIGISDTEQIITEETENRNQLSEELDKIIGVIDDARNELFGIEESEEEEPAEGEGDETTGDEATGDEPSTDVPGGVGGEGTGEEEEEDEEEFFDPSQFEGDYELTEEDFEREIYEQIIVEGNVSYKDVYLDYYASALESISRGEIPDELKDVIINYFTSLE